MFQSGFVESLTTVELPCVFSSSGKKPQLGGFQEGLFEMISPSGPEVLTVMNEHAVK